MGMKPIFDLQHFPSLSSSFNSNHLFHHQNRPFQPPQNAAFSSLPRPPSLLLFSPASVHLRRQRRLLLELDQSSPAEQLRAMALRDPDDQPALQPYSNYDGAQLNDESDFEKILSPEGYVSVCGFGSLLSERSARSTFPELMNFRVGRLKGFRRVFAHSAPVFFERGIAKPETKEISSLSVEPCDGEMLIVTVFEIQKSEIPAYIQRELEFCFLAVIPESLGGKPYTNPAVLCTRYSDEEFFNIRCKGSKEIYHQLYGRFGIDKIWRDDILPCRTYLRHCVLAAKNLSPEAYDNLLDHTYLGDRKTSIREYLATIGAGIMEEEPPESLKTRYGG